MKAAIVAAVAAGDYLTFRTWDSGFTNSTNAETATMFVEAGATAAVIVHHELSKSDPGFCPAYLAHSMLFVNNFYQNADDPKLRERVLPKVVSGEWVGGMCMSEPAVGTDVMGMETTAVRDGDRYLHMPPEEGTRRDIRVIQAVREVGIEVLDDRTVAFTTSEPFAPFLPTVGGVFILPEHVDTPLEYKSMSEVGGALGSGTMLVR